MKQLYAKNELSFSLALIAFYVILFSAADSFSASVGIVKIFTAPLCILFAIFLWIFIRKNHLEEKYGLCRFHGNARNYLYFIPLFLLASCNLWGGITLRLSLLESILYVASMLCVGFIEEIIFRGFLFKALCITGSIRQAVLISSITFGFGHIVNLLNGAELFSTLLQICYAAAIGFLFTVLFYRGKSLVPCILTHSVVNSLSAFAVTHSDTFATVSASLLTIVSAGYGVWILKLHKTD